MKKLLTLLLLVVGMTAVTAQEEVIKQSQASGDYLFINIKVKNNVGQTSLIATELNYTGEDTVLIHQVNTKFITVKLSLNQDYELVFLNNGKEKHMFVFSDDYDTDEYWVYLDLDWKSDTDVCSVVYEEKISEFEVIVPMAGKSKK